MHGPAGRAQARGNVRARGRGLPGGDRDRGQCACARPPHAALGRGAVPSRKSHIATDECGAPEFFGGGIKLVGLVGEAGKIAPADAARALDAGQWGGPHHVSRRCCRSRRRPKPAPSIASGEIRELADIAHARGMARAHGRRPARQCARAHECLAGAGDLAGGRRRALVRRHQGRRARRRSGRVLRSGARREHAGAAQARRPSRFQASLRRRADRGVSRERSVAEAGRHANAMADRLAAGLAAAGLRRSGRSRRTRCSSRCRRRPTRGSSSGRELLPLETTACLPDVVAAATPCWCVSLPPSPRLRTRWIGSSAAVQCRRDAHRDGQAPPPFPGYR